MSEHDPRSDENKYLPKEEILHEHPPEQNHKKNGVKSTVFFLVAVIGFGVFKYAMKYGMTEAQVAMSKYESWSPEFKKEFVDGCRTSAIAEVIKDKDPVALSKPGVKEKVTAYAGSFCDCAAKGIEDSHILKTKYNQMDRDLASVGAENGKVVEDYLATKEGTELINGCASAAIKNLK